ncbi:MAG: alpha/beta hydrolase [Planctomycetes bacterium]|nr:alpha/beta hydrolase [Planctomycetota bacterium]
MPRRAVVSALALLSLAVGLSGCALSAVLSSDAEMRFPDVGNHVVVRDGRQSLRLRYVERGDGRSIVLLHGAYGGLEDWQATILDDVALRGRAIAFDRPGHGWSDRPCESSTPEVQAGLLRDACRSIGASHPVLVGFSWGGAVAAAWAARWPDEVEGLVLLNAPTHSWGGAPEPIDTATRVPFFGEFLTANVFSVIGPFVAPSRAAAAFLPEAVPASFAKSPLDLALRPATFDANAADVTLLDGALAAQSPGYASIRCPVVFVVGDGDRIVGPEFHSPRFVAAVPQTRRVVVAGAGHQLPYAHPAECMKALDDVLATRR